MAVQKHAKLGELCVGHKLLQAFTFKLFQERPQRERGRAGERECMVESGHVRQVGHAQATLELDDLNDRRIRTMDTAPLCLHTGRRWKVKVH